MQIEQEYKYKLSSHDVARLQQLPELSSPPTMQQLISTYFDTEDIWLFQQGYALRILEKEGRYFQTLKGGGYAKGAFHQRYEWHQELSHFKVDCHNIPIPAIQKQLSQFLIDGKLAPRFITDFQRCSWVFDFQSATLECSIDKGFIRSADKIEPLFELELELMNGKFQELTHFIQTRLNSLHLMTEHTSKAARGYRLWTTNTA